MCDYQEIDERQIRELITNYKLFQNLVYHQIDNQGVHYTIMATDVSPVKYLVMTNRPNCENIGFFDINVDMNDVFNFSVKITPAKFNELKLASYKTQFLLSDLETKITFKADPYYQPYDLKRSIVAFLNFQRVFRVINRYIIHVNKTADGYWVPSMVGEYLDGKVEYLTGFAFNGQTLLTKHTDRPLYIFDSKNNFEVNYNNFINSERLVKVITSYSKTDYLLEYEPLRNPIKEVRLITKINKLSYLKKSELEAQKWLVRILKDVSFIGNEVAQFALFNPTEQKAYINRFSFTTEQHNFSFLSRTLDINMDIFKEILLLTEGNILISDIHFH